MGISKAGTVKKKSGKRKIGGGVKWEALAAREREQLKKMSQPSPRQIKARRDKVLANKKKTQPKSKSGPR